MKELAGKMNDMVERIGNPQIIRSNTFYQQYKMEFDFCAKKLIDSGIAWGDGQVVKEYVSKDMLRMDKMDVYRSNYMESYRDRIITGGDEKIDTDSYIKGTTYDYSKWFKFGDFLAKTIYRPYFSSVERKVDREPVEDRFEKKEDKEEPMQDHITQPVEELKDPSTEEPEKKAEMEKEEADTKDDAMALEDQRLDEKDDPDTQEDPVPEDTTQEDTWNPDTDDSPKEPDFDYQDIDLGEQDLWNPSEEGIQPVESYEPSVESDTPYEEKEEWDPIEDVDSSAASDSDSDPRIDMKADFDKVFDGHQTTDDVFDKYAEDVFVDESVDYDTLLQAASDSISEKLFLDAPDDEKEYYQQASADIAYEVTDLDGKKVDKSIFREADVTMVNVWATFCNPCLEEMPYLAELSKEYDSKNVQIIGLCLDTIQPDGKINEENVSLAKEAVAATGADYLHLIPSMELYVGLYEYVPGVPTTFFVDQEGKLLGETVTGAKSKEDWAALLEEKLAMIQGEK